MPLNFSSTYTDIYERIAEDIRQNTPVTNFGETSTARAIAEATASVLSGMSSRIDILFSALDITKAEGALLDKLGSLFGLTRIGSTRCYSDTAVRFFLQNGVSLSDLIQEVNEVSGLALPVTDITIRAGTVISALTDATIAYETLDNYTLGSTSDKMVALPVRVQSLGHGFQYNVGIGTLTVHDIATKQWELRTISDRILVTNIEDINNGQGLEDTESFRRRIMNARRSAVTGNEVAIKEAAMSVNGVGEVLLTKYPEGLGTVGVIILPQAGVPGSTASTAVLTAVNEAVNDVVSAGCRAVVSTPEYLLISMKAKLTFSPETAASRQELLKTVAKSNIIRWTNSLGIGATWTRAGAIRAITDAGNGEIVGVDIISEEFRIKPYYRAIKVTTSGKGQIVTDLTHNQGYSGTRVVSDKLVAKMTNPPQKFLMYDSSVTIC